MGEVRTSVAFQGHLLDSLTLSKVIDRVQELGGDYRLNDIRVGSLKKDISSIHLTLIASHEADLQALLEALRPYGAVPVEQEEIQILVCQQPGALPEGAYTFKLPQQVHHDGQWLPIADGGPWALVLNNQKPCFKPASTLQPGDQLVSGLHGLKW